MIQWNSVDERHRVYRRLKEDWLTAGNPDSKVRSEVNFYWAVGTAVVAFLSGRDRGRDVVGRVVWWQDEPVSFQCLGK